MEIKGFIEFSMLDWNDKNVSVIFLPGCNFRCPYCQNSQLVLSAEKIDNINKEKIYKYLSEKHGWIDGVVITGGEPTIHKDLPEFIFQLKQITKVKLDTNGYNPLMLKNLIQSNSVDYIALDIKSSFEKYHLACGVKIDTNNIIESINIVRNSNLEYEFRTTVVPGIVTEDDILSIAKMISGIKKYVLQQFVPHNTIKPYYLQVKPYSIEILKRMADICKPYISQVVLR